MIPSKLSRAAHRVSATTPPIACCSCPVQHRSHQRRPSSSKASSSADRDPHKAATPAAKATTNVPTGEESPNNPEGQHRAAKGRPRREYRRVQQTAQDGKKTLPPDSADRFAALPSVPSVQSLSESDRSISNFFSLHRPMSITHSFPPPSTSESFGKIFSSDSASDSWANGNSAERRPEDVIYTLHTTIETLESSSNTAQDDGMRWEIIHESPSNANSGVHHLDGQPRLKSLEELVAQFKPFRAPPPPQPFSDQEPRRNARERKASNSAISGSKQAGKPKQKTFTTTITVTESTHANGKKTYSASSSPIVALAEPEVESRAVAPQETPLTRRDRVRKFRQQSGYQASARLMPVFKAPSGLRGVRLRKMYLISVKRQRKLKMKKHKYKKLMKRTRNLRRRLERN